MTACLAAIAGFSGCAVKKPPAVPQIVQQSLPPTTKIRDQWTSPGAAGLVQNGWLKTFSDPQVETWWKKFCATISICVWRPRASK